MAKKTSRSEADDTKAPAVKRKERDRVQPGLGAAAVAKREPDSIQLNGAQGPETISRQLDAAGDRVQQAPGDALAASEDRWTDRTEPTEQDIRDRAYQMYLERGAYDGQDFDDWLRAEVELKQRR
jgi:hypothetical protein